MSSTPAVVTPISVSSSLSPNAPLPPPSRIPSSSDPVSILTSVTASSTLSTITPVTKLAFLEQSSSGKTTTTSSSVGDTVSVPSSTVPSFSANVSSMSSSARSSTTSSSVSRSTTSSSETIVPTTSSTSSPTTSQSSTSTSTSTSFNSTTSLLEKTTPLALSSSTTTPSNTPFSTSSPLHPDPSSQSFPPGTDTPPTTVFASTTIFITSTNSQGQLISSAPPVVTEVITTTGSGGIVTTVTQAVVNPTLASNNSTGGPEPFFADTGAVVGVFVVVGLACASIMTWILFAIRRRQRMRRIEQDTVAEAAVTAAGLNRTPLDDDAEEDSLTSPNTHHQLPPGMGQRSRVLGPGFLPTSVRLPEVIDGPVRGSANPHPRYSAERCTSTRPEGYMPARTRSPLPRAEQCIDDPGSSHDRRSSYGHTPTYSAGSFEPLLASYARTTSDRDTSAPGVESPQNRSSQHIGSTSAPNDSSESPDNGSRNSLKRQDSSDSSVFQDEEDYTRYVLMVRNLPDDQSQHSL